jgi:NTE family protein
MFGAWQVGVWKVLRTRLQPDMIVGASAGAWNGWAIAGGATIEELAKLWLDPGTSAILRPLWHPRPQILRESARNLFARFRPRIPYGLTVVEVPRMKAALVRDDAVTALHLAATASIPVMFPPVRIDGRRYVDGGLMGALPLWAAEKMGATRAVALNVLTTLPFRALHTVIRPPRATRSLDVVLLEPSRHLGTLRAAAVWSAANIERWIRLGEQDANRALTSVTM